MLSSELRKKDVHGTAETNVMLQWVMLTFKEGCRSSQWAARFLEASAASADAAS